MCKERKNKVMQLGDMPHNSRFACGFITYPDVPAEFYKPHHVDHYRVDSMCDSNLFFLLKS